MIQIKKILFARDFSPASEGALPFALKLARRFSAELHVLYVVEWQGDGLSLAPCPEVQRAQLYERLLDRTSGPDVSGPDAHSVILAVEWDTAAAPAILRYAEVQAVDLIVMGTHGARAARHGRIGSVTEEVVRLGPCPVLVLRELPERPPATAYLSSILVPVDFASYSSEALRYAKELAALLGAKVTLLHVIDTSSALAFHPPGLLSGERFIAEVRREALGHLRRHYRETEGPSGPAVQCEVQVGDAAATILQYAGQSGADLIVMGTHGLSGIEHFVLGSVAEQVLRRAPCPVLATRRYCFASPGPEHEAGPAAEKV